uniref:Uncharacterized protein n=1 Tax=Ursus americanus TaxID=9643 RepID=A0A452QYI7_URSAM
VGSKAKKRVVLTTGSGPPTVEQSMDDVWEVPAKDSIFTTLVPKDSPDFPGRVEGTCPAGAALPPDVDAANSGAREPRLDPMWGP